MKSTLIISALVVLLLVPQQAPGQEPLKLIYSQFTMTNSATWFAREAGLFERHGLNADLIYVDSAPAVQALNGGPAKAWWTARSAAAEPTGAPPS